MSRVRKLEMETPRLISPALLLRWCSWYAIFSDAYGGDRVHVKNVPAFIEIVFSDRVDSWAAEVRKLDVGFAGDPKLGAVLHPDSEWPEKVQLRLILVNVPTYLDQGNQLPFSPS